MIKNWIKYIQIKMVKLRNVIGTIVIGYLTLRTTEFFLFTLTIKDSTKVSKRATYGDITSAFDNNDQDVTSRIAAVKWRNVTKQQTKTLNQKISTMSVKINLHRPEQDKMEPVPLLGDSPTKKGQLWPWSGQELMEKCYKKDWYANGPLPTASVVIAFIDHEVLSTLLRTVHSILKHSPAHLLKEIILVSDNCKRDDMHNLLDITLKSMFGGKVYVLRSNVSLGITRARNAGIRIAKGDVVVSLDSHIEAQKNWLEPILYEIKLNKKTLASSFLDWLEKDKKHNTWTHKHGPSTWVTNFDLKLTFGFQTMSQKELDLRNQGKIDQTLPVRSPMTIGNWAILKEFFTEIGELDDGAIFWGADNLDISIKTWLFGGRVVNIPCSKTIHVEIPHARNYRDNKDNIFLRNYKRVLKVWMPDHIQYFESYNPDLKKLDIGNLTTRLALRAKSVHNFSWFLDNVYPEFGIPQLHGLAWGHLKNNGTGTCAELMEYILSHSPCSENPATNDFFWSRSKQMLRSPFSLFDADPAKIGSKINHKDFMTSYNMPLAKWIHWENGPLRLVDTELCLDISNNSVSLQKCDTNKLTQLWSFSHYPKENQNLIADISKSYRI